MTSCHNSLQTKSVGVLDGVLALSNLACRYEQSVGIYIKSIQIEI